MSLVVLISDLLYQSAGTVFPDGGRVSEGLVMVSLAFHLFVVGTVIFAYVLLCQVKSSRISLFLQRKMLCHTVTKTVYICERLTLKKYTTTRCIAHIIIYNKHKHNHHYSHHISSSLELSQLMPNLISATGSYWNGHIPVAISNFSGKFIRSFVH